MSRCSRVGYEVGRSNNGADEKCMSDDDSDRFESNEKKHSPTNRKKWPWFAEGRRKVTNGEVKKGATSREGREGVTSIAQTRSSECKRQLIVVYGRMLSHQRILSFFIILSSTLFCQNYNNFEEVRWFPMFSRYGKLHIHVDRKNPELTLRNWSWLDSKFYKSHRVQKLFGKNEVQIFLTPSSPADRGLKGAFWVNHLHQSACCYCCHVVYVKKIIVSP